MKKSYFFSILFGISALTLFSQEQKEVRIPLIGEAAPSFTAESTRGKIVFPDDYYGKWKILFSHPGAFTPVCTSELLELATMQDGLEKLNAKVVVLSTDGLNSQMAWIRSMESIRYNDKDPVRIGFPLVSDNTMEISRKYGMLHSSSNPTRDVRGVFIIDGNDKVKAVFFYPMNVGRNMEEIRRTLVALQTAEDHNVLTPANWNPGDDVLIQSPRTEAEASKLAEKNDPDLRRLAWYLWFKKMK